ncbi:MAG: hypothetical protein IJD13_04460 [Oscillospiraceae bacterium]|nr:hypothetical protein [Oscillospiraceae bacterium]
MNIRHLMKIYTENCRQRRFRRYVERKLKGIRICPAGEPSSQKKGLIEESIMGPAKLFREEELLPAKDGPVCE